MRQRGISRVCRVMDLERSTFYYTSRRDDSEVEFALKAQAEKHPKEGFRLLYDRMRLQGCTWNHKRVHRVYKKLGLSLRVKRKKRLPARVKQRLKVPTKLNHTWSIDFIEDRLRNGRKVRSFNVMDDANREALFIESYFSLKSTRVVWVLNHLIRRRAKPKQIRMDNGPEFIANLMDEWSEGHGIRFIRIQPGKPTQNAYIERLNRTYREKVLDAFSFSSLDELREQNQVWMDDYNNHRPNKACKRLPPVIYAQQYLTT